MQLRLGGQWKLDGESSAASCTLAVRVDRPTMEFHELLADGKAKSQAALGSGGRYVRLAETLKDVRHEFRTAPAARVAAVERARALFPRQLARNPATAIRELHRVVEQ